MKTRRFSEEQILRILQEADHPDKTVEHVCIEHNVWGYATTQSTLWGLFRQSLKDIRMG